MTDTLTPVRYDFSSKKQPFVFTMDGDVFTAARELPAGVVKKLSVLQGRNNEEQVELVMEMLDMILHRESAERFAQRMNDPENPISVPQILEMMTQLLEVYGLRPTTPSLSSATSPMPTGTTSTDGVALEESTPTPSPSTDT